MESSIQWTAHLVEQYITAHGRETFPPTDPTFTMTPDFCRFITGITNWDKAKGAKTLTSNIRFDISVSTSLG